MRPRILSGDVVCLQWTAVQCSKLYSARAKLLYIGYKPNAANIFQFEKFFIAALLNSRG